MGGGEWRLREVLAVKDGEKSIISLGKDWGSHP